MPRHAISRFPTADSPTLSGWSMSAPALLRALRRETRSRPTRVPAWARSLVAGSAAVWSDRSVLSVMSHRSVASVASAFSFGSVMSAGSLLSAGSLASVASSGSVLSIASSGSVLSIGASGGFLQVGAARSSEHRAPPDAAATESTVRKLSGFLAMAAIVSAPFARSAAA